MDVDLSRLPVCAVFYLFSSRRIRHVNTIFILLFSLSPVLLLLLLIVFHQPPLSLVHNLNKKQTKLKINYSNKNDIIRLIGPPSTKSTFDNDMWIYIERKISNTHFFGKRKLIVNNVLILEINDLGIVSKKNFLDINKMTDINLDSEDDVLVIPPGNWACQTGLKRKNLLLVLASEPYDKNDYFYDHL